MLLSLCVQELIIRRPVNLQNDGPVSVDYQSHDAEVIETFSLLCLNAMKILTECPE